MKKSYKILKMKSGEEIIAGVRKTKDGKLKLHRPMVFKSMVSPDIFGGVKEIFMLKNWLVLSSEQQTIIQLDSVNTILEPTMEVSNLYEAEKNKEDKYTLKAKQITPPLFDLPQNETLQPKQDQKDGQQSQDSIDNLQQKLEKMIEDMLNIPEEESNLKELAKHEKGDKMVFMNLVFSPDVIVELLRSGVLNRKEFGEMINHLTNNNGEGMNPSKFTGNKKNKKNFGNDWTDWNPDPSSEDYR